MNSLHKALLTLVLGLTVATILVWGLIYQPAAIAFVVAIIGLLVAFVVLYEHFEVKRMERESFLRAMEEAHRRIRGGKPDPIREKLYEIESRR